ncbi:MAG TPA: sugar phosphate isomerase [Candidatus Latescibacteria bacterium]|jgi:sugar phosphate isomerase/epimerase|nr:sugar phosphate isomerase [Candidatus Latescibacterota bacterium]
MGRGLIGVQMMMLGSKVQEMGAYTVLEKLAEIGYHCIEISQIAMTPKNVSDIRKACDAFGIRVAACSAALEPMGPSDALTTNFNKIVDDCKTLDTDLLRLPMLPFDYLGNRIKALEFIARAEVMAARLAEHGIELYYHNHHHEFERYEGKYLMDIIKDSTERLGFELDVHWIQRGGENPITYIQQFAGRIKLIHLKDYRIKIDLSMLEGELTYEKIVAAFDGAVQFAEVGEGNLPIKKIIETGFACGSEYFLVEQDFLYNRDPFDCLITSRDNLYKLGYRDWFTNN